MGNVTKFRSRRLDLRYALPLVVALAFAATWAVMSFAPGASIAPPQSTIETGSRAASQRLETAQFALCRGGIRVNCVIDGDTFYFHGEKIRVADIDAPETHPSRCSREDVLGTRATEQLIAMLNDGAFSLEPGGDGRDADVYGRKLRIVMRGGASLGEKLVSQGLAHPWVGHKLPWC